MNLPDPPADHDHDNPTLDAPCLGCRCRAIMEVFEAMNGHPEVIKKMELVGAAMRWYCNPDRHEVILMIADAGPKPTRPPLIVAFGVIDDGSPVDYSFIELASITSVAVDSYDDGPRPVGDGAGMIRSMHAEGMIPTADELAVMARRRTEKN